MIYNGTQCHSYTLAHIVVIPNLLYFIIRVLSTNYSTYLGIVVTRMATIADVYFNTIKVVQ